MLVEEGGSGNRTLILQKNGARLTFDHVEPKDWKKERHSVRGGTGENGIEHH